MRWPFKILGGLIIIAFIAAVFASRRSYVDVFKSSPPSQINIDQDSAKIRAKEFIGASLKAPSTAKWPGYNEFAVAQAVDKNKKVLKDTWDVVGYVDSQNSYGAMLRSNFLVTLRKNGNDWSLVKSTLW